MRRVRRFRYVPGTEIDILKADDLRTCLAIIKEILQDPCYKYLLPKAFLKASWFVQSYEDALWLLQEAELTGNNEILMRADRRATELRMALERGIA